MAKSGVKYVQVKKVVDEERFTLELDKDEVLTLAAILERVGGDPRTTRRKYADKLRDAVQSVLMLAPDQISELTADIDNNVNRSIYFVEPKG